ncbi:MAG: hypothetical protein MUF15_20740, partial [Acidobacteria bacterium]|nr:hypothetical protein [Acidobacteriota bacterium]
LLFIPEIKQAVFEIQTRNQNYANPLKDVYEAAESVLKTFTDKLNRRAEENGVYLQLGSWLITKNEQRQIHLEGFDNIPGQTEYVVPRWQFVPTESESNNFYQFKSLAAENSARYPILILEMTREQFVLLENRLRLEMRDISDRLTPITNNIRNINADTSNIQGALNTLRTLISDYTNFVLGITAKYKNIPAQSNVGPANLIASANEDFAAIERETLTLKEKIGSQIALVERELQLLPGGVGQGNIIIIGPLGLIGPRIELQIVSWIFQAKNRLDELLKGRKFDMAALELSEAVTKMDINNIPEKTVISLKKTGIRENGDVLAIKMIVGGAKTKGAQVTETHEVTLFMVLPHIKTVAGLIFAHSTAKADQDTKFHMSPSYNFLFKGILDQKLRRKSILYNRIFEFSFGLNLASLDLNNDYVQELGIALVISAFADLAQIGYGYNITEKKPYWFFGIRLPLFPVIYF